MNATNDLRDRTRAFALRVVRLVESLPRNRTADVMGKPLLRCGTSVGANYRAACRVRSRKEFVAKLGIVEEEADESIYWLDLIADAGLVDRQRLAPLIEEADALLSITIASIRTAKANAKR